MSENIQITMTPKETAVFKKLLEDQRCVVEYGVGGSTLLALDSGVEKLYSVESDEAWLSKLKQNNRVLSAIEEKRLNLFHADIGKTGAWVGRLHENSFYIKGVV